MHENIKHNRGEDKLKELAKRPSCELFILWIINPAPINKVDLNKACMIKWRKAKSLFLNPRIVNISPNWLKVDKAITFFRSVSKLATHPAANIVASPATKARFSNRDASNKGINRTIKKTPAVTKVEE